MKVCKICGDKFFAKGLCEKHYYQQPELLERKRKYIKNYYQKPENKEKLKQYQKEYYQKPDIKAKVRKYAKDYYQVPENKERHKKWKKTYVSLTTFKNDFFNHFNDKLKDETELQKTAELFAENACKLSGRKKCELEEMIMKEAHENINFLKTEKEGEHN